LVDCIFRLRNDDNREMALAFEAWTAEERERARAGVARRRESWRRETELERHFSDTAAVVAEAREQQEMAVMAAVGMAVDAPGREERLRADRRLWTRLDECYKRLEVSAKYGVVAAERMFDTRTDVDGITQEEEKKLAKILKQLEEETKDKTGKKRKGPEGEVEKDSRGMAGGATAYGGYMQQGSGGGGQFAGAGMYSGGPPSGIQAAGGNYGQFGGQYGGGWGYEPMQAAMGFGYPAGPGWFGGWPQYGQSGQGMAMGATGGGTAVTKKKGACNNCGALDHLSYHPVCPNYSIYIQQLAAKAAAANKAAGGGGSETRTVAVRGSQGKKNIQN